MTENESIKYSRSLKTTVRNLFSQKFVNRFKHLPLAILANVYFGFPSRNLKLIGVTGTDGKTTTVSLIYHILTLSGYKTAMVSTVSAKIGEEEIDTGFHVTAPDPWLLQKLLRRMADRKAEFAVLEATSHGLDQYRLWGIRFKVAVLTNVTREHLDYHKTMENYREAKLKLFLAADCAVLNKDDNSFSYFLKNLKGRRIISYSINKKADFTPKKFAFRTLLAGVYNKSNCLAAIAATSFLAVPQGIIREAVGSFRGVTGRLEEINEGQNFRVIVDFAHTPNALSQVLTLLKRQLLPGRKLIAVFGAAGLRDQGKRPLMGEISGRLADFTVITAEDPRTEDVNQITGQIASGCKKASGKYIIITDRQEAINYAIRKIAKEDDIVVVCGKGHEKSMCFGVTEYPWSDHEAARKALQNI